MNIIPCKERTVRKWVKQGKEIVCFGNGKRFTNLCTQYPSFEFAVTSILDNDEKKWGTKYVNERVSIPVINPRDIKYDARKTILLITTAFYEEIGKQLNSDDFYNNLGIKKCYYIANDDEISAYRHDRLKQKTTIKDVIIFRSGNAKYVPGWDYTDNAKAMYDYLVKNGYDKKYKMVWIVHKPHEYPQIRRNGAACISCKWITSINPFRVRKYFKYLWSAKYIFFTDAMFWTKFCKKETVRVNLWHGNGYKAKKNKQGTRLDSFFDYGTVSGPVYIDLHEAYWGCNKKKILDTGLAKQDLLFTQLDKPLYDILKVPQTSKYIFWLPTFRKPIEGLQALYEYELDTETGLPILSTVERVAQVNKLLVEKDITLIIKMHPVQDTSMIKNVNASNIKVFGHTDFSDTGYQVNSLLTECDALISDFSSVSVDYVLKDRPIGFVLEDCEEYAESRGFVFDPIEDYLPGFEIYNFDMFIQFITDVANGDDPSREKRHKLAKLMHTHNDGNCCERILKEIGLEG